MRQIHVVTSFIKYVDKFLILKRSSKVTNMRGLWSAVSGKIEIDEIPYERAIIEIFEETGLTKNKICILKTGDKNSVKSNKYNDLEWIVYPFLFETSDSHIKLNWENSSYCWIFPYELQKFNTVPKLDKIFFGVL